MSMYHSELLRKSQATHRRPCDQEVFTYAMVGSSSQGQSYETGAPNTHMSNSAPEDVHTLWISDQP